MDPEIVLAFVRIIEIKDISTAAHTWRVVLYARALAESVGMSQDDVHRLSYAAALHDLGKIDIPDQVLLKPGPLTIDEFEVMKQHAALGHARLVRMGETDPIVLDLVRHHHERWDGSGYPDGLAGDRIPAVARLFAVVDTFDALTSIRPYRMEVGPQALADAADAIAAGAGSHFEPAIAGRFVEMVRSGSLTWISEHYNDTCPVPDYAEIAAGVADQAR